MDTTVGRRSGGVMRLRRERRGEEWRECSTSEEERDREVYTAGLASIAGYTSEYRKEKIYKTHASVFVVSSIVGRLLKKY